MSSLGFKNDKEVEAFPPSTGNEEFLALQRDWTPQEEAKAKRK